MFEFEPFDKIARLKRELVITEKLDGTNAQVAIFAPESEEEFGKLAMNPYCISVKAGEENGDLPQVMFVGSRKRYIAPEGWIADNAGDPKKGTDNFAFARFVADNTEELFKLGEGRHYGEWYGKGIQRGYSLEEKRFALFNTARWGDHNPNTPECCEVVPLLNRVYPGVTDPDDFMSCLKDEGSVAAPDFMNPEGIVVYHSASRTLYKQTFDMDGGKWRES